MKFLARLIRRLLGLDPKPPVADPPELPPGPPAPPPLPPAPHQLVEGRVVIDVQGLGKLPFSAQRDDFVLAVLTWETEGVDATVPVLGIHVRGTDIERRGFILRWSPNLLHDRQVYLQHGEEKPELFLGSGQNYHHRHVAGDGEWTITWSRNGITVVSPLGGVQSLSAKVPGSIGFGRIVTELWERRVNRYHLWKGFEASIHGVTVRLVSWSGRTGQLELLP